MANQNITNTNEGYVNHRFAAKVYFLLGANEVLTIGSPGLTPKLEGWFWEVSQVNYIFDILLPFPVLTFHFLYL